MIKLTEIIKHLIENDKDEFPWIELREQELLVEFNYNLDDIYSITNELPFNIEFKDDKERLNITKGKLNNEYIEIKLYWVDNEGKVRMDTPDGVLPKTMNTHLNNIINKFIPKYNQFIIRPNDDIRYRLFQILLNKYIDKNIWNIKSDSINRIIILVKK